MTTDDIITLLATHRTIGAAPRAELEWIATHGTCRTVHVGEALLPKGTEVDSLFIILSGRVSIHVDRGSGKRRVMEWRGGDVTGLLPYSRMKVSPGLSVALEETESFVVHRDEISELIHACPEVTAILVHVMMDRIRQFTSSDIQDEKTQALGKLAAGLAHELNNPASAAARGAKQLTEKLRDAEHAARALSAAQLTDSEHACLDVVHAAGLEMPEDRTHSPIELSDREETLSDWLAAHGAPESAAASLAATGVTLEHLDRLAAALSGATLSAAINWIASGCEARALAQEIESATSRIHNLVATVKGFTYMDHASVSESIDVVKGLGDTISVLEGKAESKSVQITLTFDPDLPPIHGFGGEFNQIWDQLIDNAIDAVPVGGHVAVSVKHEGEHVVVYIVDDGPGIPRELQERIFDPFFTTKPVGQGTGLGLDIARRIVNWHDGELDVTSQPGCTEFRVCLPVA